MLMDNAIYGGVKQRRRRFSAYCACNDATTENRLEIAQPDIAKLFFPRFRVWSRGNFFSKRDQSVASTKDASLSASTCHHL